MDARIIFTLRKFKLLHKLSKNYSLNFQMNFKVEIASFRIFGSGIIT